MIVYNSGMVGQLRAALYRLGIAIALFVLVAVGCAVVLAGRVHADQLGARSLRIEDSAVGATTAHTFTFSYGASGGAVGSIVFEYCTSPLIEIVCSAPAGLDASGAALVGQSGETGFAVLDRQANKLVLTRAPVAPTASPSQYTFSPVVNPTDTPGPFYVRITTYPTPDGSGQYTDFGAVVSSTSQGVRISTAVPPILKFCVGLSLQDDCTAADDSVVDLGDLSIARVSSGTSQMIAATNAQFGLAIAAYGTTMTSGNNTIAALDSPTVSAPGNAQFGLNLRANTNPNAGQEPSGRGIANPTSAYNIPNRYAFSSGSVVATSPAATDTRKFTATYIVNISPSQQPGIYTSTLTYICTATF